MEYNDALILTKTENWIELDDNAKVEVLQSIENQLAKECGRMPCEVKGEWLYTSEDGITLGFYNPKDNTIHINASQFDSESMYGKTAKQLIITTAHEGRHSYQNQVVRGFIEHDNPEEVKAWSENLAPGNYITFRDNPRGYYNQPVEVDARNFGESYYKSLTEKENQIENLGLSKSKEEFVKQMETLDFEEENNVEQNLNESNAIRI